MQQSVKVFGVTLWVEMEDGEVHLSFEKAKLVGDDRKKLYRHLGQERIKAALDTKDSEWIKVVTAFKTVQEAVKFLQTAA